jgi:hypothetical protein
MKVNLKIFKVLTCFLLIGAKDVQAGNGATNCVEIFYDNIQKIGQVPKKQYKEEMAIQNQEPILSEQIDKREFTEENSLAGNIPLKKEEIIADEEVEIVFIDRDDLATPPLYNNEKLDLPRERNLLAGLNPLPQEDSSPIKEETIKEQSVKNSKKKKNIPQKKNVKLPPKKTVETTSNASKSAMTIQQEKEIERALPKQPPLMSIEIPLGTESDQEEIEINTIVDKPKEDHNSVTQNIEPMDETSVMKNDSGSHSIENIEILPDEVTPTIELRKEISFEEKLKKVQEEKDRPQVKTWKDYIPFFKKKDAQKPSTNSIHIEKSHDNEELPSLPVLENEIEIQEKNSYLGNSLLNLSLDFSDRKVEITGEDKEKIDELIVQSKKNQSKLKVIGYSDQDNGESRRLALQRVINIRQYLIANGFFSDFISVQVLPANFQSGELAGIVNFFLLQNNG